MAEKEMVQSCHDPLEKFVSFYPILLSFLHALIRTMNLFIRNFVLWRNLVIAHHEKGGEGGEGDLIFPPKATISHFLAAEKTTKPKSGKFSGLVDYVDYKQFTL